MKQFTFFCNVNDAKPLMHVFVLQLGHLEKVGGSVGSSGKQMLRWDSEYKMFVGGSHL